MQTQYINEMLNLPELKICQIHLHNTEELHIEAEPVFSKQSCPCCKSDEAVIRKGRNEARSIRHLPVFDKKTYLLVPSIRMYCVNCAIGFVWSYDFVRPKQRYSQLFRSRIVEHALGSTAAHSAQMQQTPVSTVQDMHNKAVPMLSEQLIERAWEEAQEGSNLILGIDDFSIKKGHRYNTGIHNLRGATMLDVMPGRKLDDLRKYASEHPRFRMLKPKAVVMDLAQAYHTWIRECFPFAIRIADRFHVHGYVIDSVQEVRKSVQQTLMSV
ncbi:transposase [Paenibacillus sp. YYML68]|uniref:transposase n=1 Tax=Paenibacillus sp. YYML68 TaxID=2909250 RepID=UPI002491AE00|nr:transposase [Paenibacillus sp. YYML68]